MEILYNMCFGGFGVSKKALDLFNERSGMDVKYVSELDDYHRSNPILIDIVRELGDEANDDSSELGIATIPDGYGYWIEDYDGVETIHLTIKENRLRELIRLGNENDIVEYVMSAV